MLEEQMKAAGITPQYTAVEEVADQVVEGILADRFWIHPRTERGDAQMRARTESMLERTNPSYLRPVPG
jgi:hypothetical protein